MAYGKKYWEMLNPAQREWIEQYLNHRIAGFPVMVEAMVRATGNLLEKRRNAIRNELSFLLYKIMCGRQGLDYHTSLNQVDPDCFDVTDFRPDDVWYVKNGYSDYNFYLASALLRPFLFFVLMKIEHEFLDDDDDKPFQRIKRRFYSAIGSLPISPPQNIKRGPNLQKKVFLSREKIVQIYKALQTPRPNRQERLALQHLTGMMMYLLLGVRNFEMRLLRIEHFDLNDDGFLKTDQDNWGILRIQESKGDYSPSHPEYGTLIVPRLTRLVDRYLGEMYKSSPYVGKGYLFRPDNSNPERPYNLKAMTEWIRKERRYFTFLSEREMNCLSSHDGRHTLNDLIRSSKVEVDLKTQLRASQIHVRHDVFKRNGDTGSKFYEDEISQLEYFQVIKDSLDFPWDLDELKQWERERGYTKVPDLLAIPKQKPYLSVHRPELTAEQNETIELLDKYQTEFDALCSGRPKSMQPRAWVERLQWLQHEISLLEVACIRKL